ncbi:hypothetical protein H7B90_26200 [Cohnella xylanilytica]|uniref:Uncharacterized protein n=1 Tax=Cohnella xylanilytica TaxID=557555 RepID=A0A841U9I3_9BACL|nr:hypothetical protein [Cohnella xylanilytica]MBB6694893.1 hypothetical protein [Cohnella xylanilytica]
MFEWFEKLIRDTIWKAIADFFEMLPGLAEDAIREKLHSLTAGQELSSSPLVRVLGVDIGSDTITLLVRGAFPIGGVTPFMRLEIVISRSEVHLSFAEAPIRIVQWKTVLGDLTVESEGKYKGSLGFGYEDGAWLGQGSLKLIPLDISGAIYGGFSDRGMILGLDGQAPRGSSIPLGPTGLGLRGLGGDFAYNFVPRLEQGGIPIPKPSAADYVTWARAGNGIDRWKNGPIGQTSVGVGVRTVLCTIADQGFAFELNPVGFAFLMPSGTFIVGGKGVLLKREGFGAEGFFVFDAASASLALGLGVNVELKKLIKGSGQLDVFFSFSDPTAWYLDLGTESRPVKLELLKDVPVVSILLFQKADAYFRINHRRIAFGGSIGIGGKYEIGDVITLIARLAVSLNAYVGWDPLLVRAQIKVHGELGIKVWKFELILSGDASAEVYFPDPTLFRFEIGVKLDLPWPIPDVSFTKSFGDNIASAPALSSPLTVGTYEINGAITAQQQTVTAIHVLSDLQWNLDADKPWPDLDLVIPFTRRVRDMTGKVEPSQNAGPSEQGGYTVTEDLLELELFDLVHHTAVPDVGAVWAEGPGGGTAQLHILGSDPFAWITAKSDTLKFPVSEQAEKLHDLFFGYGAPEAIPEARKFGSVEYEPSNANGAPDRLIASFQPVIPTRVLATSGFSLRFLDLGGSPVLVSEVSLFVIAGKRAIHLLSLLSSGGAQAKVADLGPVTSNLRLVSVTFRLPVPVDRFTLQLESIERGLNSLYVYAIRYRETVPASSASWTKKTLKPGKYRLTLKGRSKAEHPASGGASVPYPPASPVEWAFEKEFEVVYPETLRPYIYYSTFGDTRLFANARHPWTTWTKDKWNPTQYGFGFPVYRSYKVAVRFVVPYVSEVFGSVPLIARISYEDGIGDFEETLTPAAAADGLSSLPPESRNWILARGGSVPADQEAELAGALPRAGAAKLTLLFEHPVKGEVRLDEWSGYASAFADFNQHVNWPHSCVTVYYDSAGRHTTAECPLPEAKRGPLFGRINPAFDLARAGSIGHIVLSGAARAKKNPVVASEKIKPQVPPIDKIPGPIDKIPTPKPYPEEYSEPPAGWQLPPSLAAETGDIDEDAALRFIRFAAATGAKFSAGGDPLAGINIAAGSTTVEAVTDPQGRPYALWLRTPEPVDWRRVSAELTIRHVEPAAGCPTGFAHRRKLELEVSILPGPDGSSAFLTGELAGIPALLPRGEYELRLSFDPHLAGLPRLRPTPAAGPVPETATLKFVQPLGLAWPLPRQGGIRIPPIDIPVVIDPRPFDPRPFDPRPFDPRPFDPAIGDKVNPKRTLADASANGLQAADRESAPSDSPGLDLRDIRRMSAGEPAAFPRIPLAGEFRASADGWERTAEASAIGDGHERSDSIGRGEES